MNTVHGIPLHLLANSGFFPALDTLALVWQQENDHLNSPLKEAVYTHTVGVAVFVTTCFLLCVGMIWPAKFGPLPMVCLCTLAVLIIVGLNVRCEGRQFARDLNKLENALNACDETRDIASFPDNRAEIKRIIRQALSCAANHQRYIEKKCANAESIEESRLKFVRLHEVSKTFGFDFGPYGNFFNPEDEIKTESAVK